ncbi:hypothetical protein B7463_g12052, partial [Scytalidium lignicola]
MSNTKVLLTGATGYVGGSILNVVIHTASGYHTRCAKALIFGLARRKEKTGKEVHYIHTTGTSNTANSPYLDLYPEKPSGIFSDKDPARFFSTLKVLDSVVPYPQRTTDLAVLQTGLDTGVKTYIIMSPDIYGKGTGDFNTMTIQVPSLIRSSLKLGYVWMISNGTGIWNHVHIKDLVQLYEIILEKLLAQHHLPSGEEGIYFSENGEHTWAEVAEGIAKAGFELGVLTTKEVRSVTLMEATKLLGWGNEQWTESGFASIARTLSERSHSLGWKPLWSKDDFISHYYAEWEEVLKGSRV